MPLSKTKDWLELEVGIPWKFESNITRGEDADEELVMLIPELVELVGYASLANRFGLGIGRYVGRCCGACRVGVPDTVDDDPSGGTDGGGGTTGELNGLGV